MKFFRFLGRGLRSGLVAVGALAFVGTSIGVADYLATQPGSGTTFASVVLSAKHYAALVLCDFTNGESQCAAVNASGSVQVHGQGVAGTPAGGVVSIQGVSGGTAQPVSQATAANLQATVTGVPNVTLNDCSSTITAGGTAQNAFTAQTTLHGFTIQNMDSASGSGEILWVSFTGTATAATAGSYALLPLNTTTPVAGGSFTTPPGFATNHALSVVAATTGHKFSCTWW